MSIAFMGIEESRLRSERISVLPRTAAELTAPRHRLLELAHTALSFPPERPSEAERASSRNLIPLRSEPSRSIDDDFPAPPLHSKPDPDLDPTDALLLRVEPHGRSQIDLGSELGSTASAASRRTEAPAQDAAIEHQSVTLRLSEAEIPWRGRPQTARARF